MGGSPSRITGTIIIPSLAAASSSNDCHGKVCHPVEEFCYMLTETCRRCADICDEGCHNFEPNLCAKECQEYNKYESLKTEIHKIHSQQNIVLILLVLLIVFIFIRYLIKCAVWIRNRRCTQFFNKFYCKKSNKMNTLQNKDAIGATTIRNVMTINDKDIERASQIYSVTGAEGSVMTVTTPVSTRYPAENSTTPTTEYSYDNQALAVTPISEPQRVF